MLLRMKIYGYLWILWSLSFILEAAKQPLKFHYVYMSALKQYLSDLVAGKNSQKKSFRKALRRMPKNILDRHIWRKACVLAMGCHHQCGRVFFLARFYGEALNCTVWSLLMHTHSKRWFYWNSACRFFIRICGNPVWASCHLKKSFMELTVSMTHRSFETLTNEMQNQLPPPYLISLPFHELQKLVMFCLHDGFKMG